MEVTTNLLIPATFNGQNVFRLDTNENKKADDTDPILVKKDADGQWKPVDTLDKAVDRFQMGKSYGLWDDKEVTKTSGILWWKKTEVVRPKDGAIDADEISPLALHHRGPENWREIGYRDFYVGAEVALNSTPAGNLTVLRSVTNAYNDRLVDARYYAYVESEKYRLEDSNWLVQS